MKLNSRLRVFLLLLSSRRSPSPGASRPVTVVAKPVKLSIIDVAGNLALSKPAFEAFKAAHPELVADIEYIQLTAPELPSKIKAQQMAGNIDTTLVLTGYDAMASGMDMDIYEQLMPKYSDAFQKTIDNYLPGAKAAYDLFKGYGIAMVFCPGGPMFTYNPDKVPNPAQDRRRAPRLGQGQPRQVHVRPSRQFGPRPRLPPGPALHPRRQGPQGPDHLGQDLGLSQGARQLHRLLSRPAPASPSRSSAEGTRWILASHLGWDMQQRILATIPANYPGLLPQRHDLGQRLPVHGSAEGPRQGQARGHHRADEMDDDARPAGRHLRQRLLLSRPRDQGRHARHGSRRQPGGSQGRDAPCLRSGDREVPNTTQLDPVALVKAMDMWDQLVGAKIKK